MSVVNNKRLLLMNKALRRVIFGLIAIVFIVSALLAVSYYKKPLATLSEKSVLDYTQVAALDYTVSMKPSTLYLSETLEPGGTYLTLLVDSINISASYGMSVMPSVPVMGVSEISAVLRAYDSTAFEARPIWEKPYQILSPVEFLAEDGEVRLARPVVVDLEPYAEEIVSLYDIADVRPAKATLTMEWTVTSKTVDGKDLESAMVRMVVPVAARYFTITLDPRIERSVSVTEPVEVTDARVLAGRRVWTSALLVSVVSMAAMVCFTGARKADPEAIMMTKFERKYGARTVLASAAPCGVTIDVASMEDLAKIADEGNKPILCVVVGAGERHYFVVDGSVKYRFVMRLEIAK